MKVYVISSGEFSEYHIAAVALEEKEARMKCAVLNNDSDDDYYEIEEYDTDEVKVSTNADINLRFFLHVRKSSGNVIAFTDGYMTTEQTGINVEYDYYNKEIIRCRAILPYGTTKEKARKIMLDRIAKFKAEQAGI